MANRQERRSAQPPTKQRPSSVTTYHHEAVLHQFSGPLPPPQDLEHFEKILPGTADRIITMAEKQQEARHKRELAELELRKTDQDAFWRNSTRGQCAAFILALTAIGGATYLGVSGHEWIASALVGSTFIGFIGAFLRPSKTYQSDQKDLAKKEPGS